MDWKRIVAAAAIISGCALALASLMSPGSLAEVPAPVAMDGRAPADARPADGVIKLPALTAGEVRELIASQKLCRMALNDKPWPYIIAMDYLYLDGKLYFHFADYGRKMDLIEKDPNVSVMIDNLCGAAGDFDTVMLAGRLERVTDKDEMTRVAQALVSTANDRGGARNVAARHGLESLDPGALAAPSQKIYRLDAEDNVALRSPA